jgi:hypothetical protein
METRKVIVKDYTNGFYHVIDFENSKIPNNYVSSIPAYNDCRGERYNIPKHEIEVFWTVGYYYHYVSFTKDKIELQKVHCPSIYVVCEYLNKFESMSDEAFEKYFNSKIDKTKEG